MPYKINSNCIGCGTCASVCPVMAIGPSPDGKYEIDPVKCQNCGNCASGICPVDAIAKDA